MLCVCRHGPVPTQPCPQRLPGHPLPPVCHPEAACSTAWYGKSRTNLSCPPIAACTLATRALLQPGVQQVPCLWHMFFVPEVLPRQVPSLMMHRPCCSAADWLGCGASGLRTYTPLMLVKWLLLMVACWATHCARGVLACAAGSTCLTPVALSPYLVCTLARPLCALSSFAHSNPLCS